MKLLSTKIRGSIGLKKGMGIDEISLDLSNLSGLIALDGENGKGKSTFLESLPPYPVMPSRKGALQHQFFLKESCLDREYLFNNDRIRCLVKINGGSNYSPEGFIWINDQPKVEGKISSYKELIQEIFGSQQLFYNSAFCSQGSDNLNDLDPADLKNLFAEFLQLNKYIRWEDISKASGKILNGKLAAVEKSIMVLESKRHEYLPDTSEKITEARQQKEQAEKELTRLTGMIKTITDKIEVEKKKITENDKLVSRSADIKKSLEQVQKDLETEESQSRSELETIRTKAQGIISQLKQHEETLKDKDAIEKAVEDIENMNNELALCRASINKTNDIISGLSTRISELDKQRRELTDKSTKEQSEISTIITDLQKQRREHQFKLETAQNDNSVSSFEAELLSLRKQTEILNKRNEDPNCPDHNARCFFVASAFESKDKIPEIEKKIEAKKQDLKKAKDTEEKAIADIDKQVEEKQAELKTLQEKYKTEFTEIDDKITRKNDMKFKESEALKSTKNRLDAVEKKIAELRPTAAKADQIKVAESQVENLKTQKEEVTKEGLALKGKWDTKLNALRKREQETASLLQDIEKKIDTEVDARLTKLNTELSGLTSLQETTQKNITDTESKIKDLEREALELEKLNKDLDAAQAEKSTINSQISLWAYTQNACSKDGLRALEIDSVVPNIVHETNELLLNSSFGTIKIITQDPDTGREVFRIYVIDEDGDEVPLELRSGGQKIWPVQALRLGMTLISKQKSTYNYLTAFNDELDGPLDVENAKRFISLYPQFMQKGGFDTCFFITHKKECVELADHRIVFNCGITVE